MKQTSGFFRISSINQLKLTHMTTRILKFKHTSDKAVEKIIDDIKFCGGTVKEKTKLLSHGLIYITIEERDNSFVRRFRETRSGNFLLN